MTEPITSRQNTRVKAAAKLRDARQRKKQGRFLIDGVREIGRALDAGVEILEVFLCTKLCTSTAARTLLPQLAAAHCVEVTAEVFEKVCFGNRHDGLVVVARTPQKMIAEFELPPRPLVAVLEGLEKPGNLGAILRTADGAGIDAVIVIGGGTDLFNPNTIRASVGTVFSNKVCVASLAETLAAVHAWKLPIFATKPQANTLYDAVDYSQGAALILGSEAEGLSADWDLPEISGVRLPMQGIADSLNVSVTAGILFYEARRQRAESSIL